MRTTQNNRMGNVVVGQNTAVAHLPTVMGIPVNRLRDSTIMNVKIVARIVCLIVLFEWTNFVITCVHAFQNQGGSSSQQGGDDSSSRRGALATVFASLVSVLLFGCAVPWCGWRGAHRRNASLLQSFCLGEAAVAFCGGLGVIIAVASASAYRNACDSETCQAIFVNASLANPSCQIEVRSGIWSNRNEATLSKDFCEDVGRHWYYLVNVLLLSVSALLGLYAACKTRRLRVELLQPRVRSRVPPSANVVAVEASVIDINQNTNSPMHDGNGIVAVSSMELVARAAPPLPHHVHDDIPVATVKPVLQGGDQKS